MDNRNLLKISLSIALIGTLFLLLLTNLEPKLSQISNLDNKPLNNLVKIQGKIISSREINPNFYILTIQDNTGQIEILLNKKFENNKTLEIIGRLNKYQNKPQIQAEQIKEK